MKILLASLCVVPVISFANAQIVPVDKIGWPPEVVKLEKARFAEQKRHGYARIIYVKHPDTLPPVAPQDLIYDTTTKTHLKQVKLNFSYKPDYKHMHITGFAPAGTYNNGRWTGVKMFFNAKNVGKCSITSYDYSSSHLNVRMPKEFVLYSVHNHPTTICIEGNNLDAYTFNVSWSNSKFFNELECNANYYGKRTLHRVLEIARKLDHDLYKH